MTEKLTKSFVKGLAPGKKERVVFDSETPGFAAKVTPTGRRVFLFQYRVGGRRGGKLRRIHLGEFESDTTVEKARGEAEDHRTAVRHGQDPYLAIKAKREEAAATAAAESEDPDSKDPGNVRELATEYLARWAIKKRSKDEDERSLTKNVLPYVGDMKIGDVGRRDIVKMLDRVVDRGSPIAANRLHALIRRLFRFAVARGLLVASPCAGIEKPSEEKPRERHLDAKEIPVFWNALDGAAMEPGIRRVLRFTLATAQRRSEALFINKREIDRKESTWLIPAERSKNKRPHLVPLTKFALSILDEEDPNDDGFYFISTRTGKPYLPQSIDHACHDLFTPRPRRKHRKDGAAKDNSKSVLKGIMEPLTPHDLRRTASTLMRECGVSRDDVKLVLNHTDPSVTRRHYDRYEGLPEKKRALALLADYLERLLTEKEPERHDDVVVPIRTRA